MPDSTLTLTNAGRAKLEAAVGLARRAAQSSLRQSTDKILRPKVVRRAPSPSEEADTISRGSPPGGGKIGTPAGGRFLKHGVGFKYVREAIADEKAVIDIQGNTIWAKFGNVRRLNAQIGFGWKKKIGKNSYTRRTTRTGDSRWNKLIEMWEYGGSGAFVVKPRDSKDWQGRPAKLLPQDKKPVSSMTKFIPPKNMFRNGLRDSRTAMIAFISNSIKSQVKKRFGR